MSFCVRLDAGQTFYAINEQETAASFGTRS